MSIVPKKEFVYLIQADNYYKVGKSQDPAKRLNELQTASPVTLTLIAFFESCDAIQDERNIHDLLAQYAVRGEWFSIPEHLIRSLDSWFYSTCEAPKTPRIKSKPQNGKKSPSVQWVGEGVGFIASVEKYEGSDGYSNLVADLMNGAPSATFFVMTETSRVIRYAVENQDDYILFFVYRAKINPAARMPSIDDFSPEFIDLVDLGMQSACPIVALCGAMMFCYPKYIM